MNEQTIEERICIAGNYEADKIALIRELMEEAVDNNLTKIKQHITDGVYANAIKLKARANKEGVDDKYYSGQELACAMIITHYLYIDKK